MRITPALLLAAILGSTACSSPDEASGDMHLVLVQAPATATPGSPASQAIVVRVVNGDGVSVPGVPVIWSIRSGNGRLRASADTSGVDGLVAARWTPGVAAGSQQIGVMIYDQPALTITVEAEVFHADKITTAYTSGCGLRGSGVWCWNYEYGETTARILRVLPELEVRDIAMSGSFLCVLEQAGSVYCQRAFGDPSLEPMGTVQGLPALSAVSAGGGGGFCGLAQADGTPWCWDRRSLTASQRSSTLSFTRITGAGFRGCGLTSEGAAWCWGYGVGGPELLPGGHTFRDISAGIVSGCAIEAPDALYCWDAGDPTPRALGISASQVALGSSGSFVNASLGAQELYFWSLEPPAYDLHSAFPFPVTQVSDQDDTGCVIAYDDAVYCLGVNDNIEQVYKSTWEGIPPPQP